MKAALDKRCRKCGGQVWYIFKTSKRCVDCAHARAMISRGEVRLLQKRARCLEALLTETLLHIDASAVGHDPVLGLVFDCNCLRCRVAEVAIGSVLRYPSADLNATDRQWP